MNSNGVFLWCTVGFIFFSIGGVLRMYMVVRVKGWSGYLAKQNDSIDTYRKLIANNQAPRSPLIRSYLLIALGITLVFGSILLSK